MANQYEIPWAPPDFSAALSHLSDVFQQKKANKRADEYARMQREAMDRSEKRMSAEEARKRDDEKHRLAIEAFNAGPAVRRLARQSVPEANQNPYGFKFEEHNDLPSNVEGPELSPSAEAARFALGQPQATSHYTPVEQPPVGDLLPTQEGPEQNPMAEAARFMVEGPQAKPNGYHGGGIDAFGDEARQITAENIANVGAGMGQPSPDMMQETPDQPPAALAASSALAGPMGQRRVYEVFNGQRSELPEQTEKTPFGPDYDTIYRGLLETGEDPHKAMQYVAAQYKADQTQEHIAKRTAENTAALIGGRDTAREDQQAFAQGQNEKYKLTFDQRKQLANIMARAKVEAAGAGPVHPGVAVLVGMKEQGASDEEIYAAASKMKGLSQKEVVTPVQNVVKNAAAGERAGQKREALTATDDHGNVIGVWKDANAAKIGAKQIESYHRVDERLNVLIKDIEAQGSRVLTPDQIQKRLSYAKAVVAALRPFNELSNTAAGAQMEEDILGAIGTPGHGWLMGANADIIKHLRDEARGQHEAQLGTKLRPGGGSQMAPALGGPRHQAGGGSHPAKAPVGETRTGPDGRTYRKVGPNNWQPVEQ